MAYTQLCAIHPSIIHSKPQDAQNKLAFPLVIRMVLLYCIPLAVSQVIKIEVRDVEIMKGGGGKSWFLQCLKKAIQL
jgi:hypothetical protein